jgi:hypothetical protein
LDALFQISQTEAADNNGFFAIFYYKLGQYEDIIDVVTLFLK